MTHPLEDMPEASLHEVLAAIEGAIKARSFATAAQLVDLARARGLDAFRCARAECDLYLAEGRYEDAARIAERIRTRWPGKPYGLRHLVQAFEMQGDLARARAALDAVPEGLANDPWLLARRYLCALKTDRAEAGTRFQAMLAEKWKARQFLRSGLRRLPAPEDRTWWPQIATRVISLRRSRRRVLWSYQSDALRRVTDFEVFDAVDARAPGFDPAAYRAYRCSRLPDCFDAERGGGLSIGHLGCTLSHSEVWLQAGRRDDLDYLLVFEDDALMLPDIDRYLAELVEILGRESPPFDVVHLGNRASRWFSDTVERVEASERQAVIPISDLIDLCARAKTIDARWRSVNSRIFGGDAFLMSRRGLRKLVELVDGPGLYNDQTLSGNVGIERYMADYLALSGPKGRLPGRPAFVDRFDAPYLSVGAVRYPLSVTLFELGADDSKSHTALGAG